MAGKSKFVKRRTKRWTPKKGMRLNTNARGDVGHLRGPFKSYVEGDPFPPAKLYRLIYAEQYALTAGTSGVVGTAIAFNLNNINDPNLAGGASGGHQPYGHDTLATVYNKYKVSGVKIEAHFSDPSEDGIYILMEATGQTATSTMAGSSINYATERPMVVTRYLNDTGSQQLKVSQFFPIHTLLGITKTQFNADTNQYSANMNDNPAAIPKLYIGLGSLRGSSAANAKCTVKLTYYTMCYDRLILGQS